MRKIFTCIIIFNFCYSVFGQYAPPENLIYPPSANASALAKYAKIPVDLYTGVPKIDLPLLTLKGRDMDIPLSISYHSAGNKVNAISSPIGLGWVLNGGGVITRVVRGKHDDAKNGYVGENRIGLKITDTDFVSLSGNDRKNTVFGAYDTEPDIFYFNFLGNIGRFVFGSEGEIIMTPEQDFKIIPPFGPESDGNNYWEIIDKNGHIFKFDKKENSKITSKSYDYTSSWFLTSIESNLGNIIRFEYSEGEKINSKTKVESFPDLKCNGNDYDGTVGSRTTVIETLNPQYLSKITSSFGSVEILLNSERSDIPGGKRTYGILLKNNKDTTIKKFRFNQSYFNTSDNCQDKECFRLKLESIDELSPINNSKYINTYSFEYNSTLLPRRDSPEIDHWGYYNNNNQDYFLSRSTPYDIDAIRQPDEISSKACILEKVNYATGGSVSFDYELNEYLSSTSTNLKSGGLRITSISENYANSTPEIVTNYQYYLEGTNSSSGTQYNIADYVSRNRSYASAANIFVYCHGDIYFSHSLNNLYDLNGSNISYGNVTIINPDGSKEINLFTDLNTNKDIYNQEDYFSCTVENSKIKYSIKNISPYGSPFSPPSYTNSYQRGALVEKTLKNSNGNTVYQLKNTYQEKTPNLFFKTGGYKLDRRYFVVGMAGWQAGVNVGRYYETNGMYQLSQTVEKTFFSNGTTELTTNYNYTNEKPTLVKEKVVQLSNGDLKKEEFTYPFDLSGTTNDVFSNKNMISSYIKKKEFLNDVQVYSEERIFNYNTPNYINNGGIPLFSRVNKKKGVSNEFTNMIIDKYDEYGNILQYHTLGDKPTCYIWGYDKKYLIAKIENASYSEIEITLGDDLNKLNRENLKDSTIRLLISKLRSTLSNAMITTYTYKPLIGITSITDPRGYTSYYEYDLFNRLKYTKDNNSNILKETNYNYTCTRSLQYSDVEGYTNLSLEPDVNPSSYRAFAKITLINPCDYGLEKTVVFKMDGVEKKLVRFIEPNSSAEYLTSFPFPYNNWTGVKWIDITVKDTDISTKAAVIRKDVDVKLHHHGTNLPTTVNAGETLSNLRCKISTMGTHAYDNCVNFALSRYTSGSNPILSTTTCSDSNRNVTANLEIPDDILPTSYFLVMSNHFGSKIVAENTINISKKLPPPPPPQPFSFDISYEKKSGSRFDLCVEGLSGNGYTYKWSGPGVRDSNVYNTSRCVVVYNSSKDAKVYRVYVRSSQGRTEMKSIVIGDRTPPPELE